MDEQLKSKLRASLSDSINEWWMKQDDVPWVGDNTTVYIADAALAVIMALYDTQEYLRREHILNA